MEIVHAEPRLTPAQALEALKIAHETKDPAVKAAALLLLHPGYVVTQDWKSLVEARGGNLGEQTALTPEQLTRLAGMAPCSVPSQQRELTDAERNRLAAGLPT